MQPSDILPCADTSPETIAKIRGFLANAESDLADYQENRGKPGYYFGRGFSGETRRNIARYRKWLHLVTGE